jgi:prevent-host-death family protein
MRSVGAYEAKTHLARLLDEVAGGETIVITKHGVPVAQLTPPLTTEHMDVDTAIKALQELRQRVKPLDGITIRELIDEGRRF